MPIVHVELFQGRSLEQKRELVRGITEVVSRTCGVAAEGVHVLIEETTRENWARGAVLNIDRSTRAATGGGDFVVVTRRAQSPNGSLPEPGGSLGTVLAESLDSSATLRLASFASTEEWTNGDGASSEGSEEIAECDRVDLPFGGGLRGAPLVERYMTISTHQVKPENLTRYLELLRIAVHPQMARLAGFVSSDVLRKRKQTNAFFIVNQWLRKQDSDAYSDGPVHAYLKTQVRALLASHSGVQEYQVRPSAAEMAPTAR